MFIRKISVYLQMILLLVFSSLANGAESVPSPTKLELAWGLPDSSKRSEFKLGEVSSSKAKMIISEVSLESANGEALSGIKIYLNSSNGSCIFSGCTDSGGADIIFLDAKAVPLILEELKEIGSRKRGGYFGIARCRPAQPVLQAYCLESFLIDETDFGILLRTPKAWFKFTGVLASDLGEIISRYGNVTSTR